MTSNHHNLDANRQYYDRLYGQLSVDKLVTKVRHWGMFLAEATRTYTSWHGLYFEGFAKCLHGKRVLELGSGNGLNALVMVGLGAEVVALDISSESTAIIEQACLALGYGKDRIRVVCGDFATLAFDPTPFDIIVGKAFLHHLTHDLELQYLQRAASLLHPEGEARFFEPAINSRLVDAARWLVPVPARPARWQWHAFSEWRARDPHPLRDNSSAHYASVGSEFFAEIDIVPIGCVERFHRLVPEGTLNLRYRQIALRCERKLPMKFRMWAARSQLIRFRRPRQVPCGVPTATL